MLMGVQAGEMPSQRLIRIHDGEFRYRRIVSALPRLARVVISCICSRPFGDSGGFHTGSHGSRRNPTGTLRFKALPLGGPGRIHPRRVMCRRRTEAMVKSVKSISPIRSER
jgi:hypothetical protein